jgi:hypothetical protein
MAEYFYAFVNGSVFGPYSLDQMEAMRGAGTVTGETHVKAVNGDWMPFQQLFEEKVVVVTEAEPITDKPQEFGGIGNRGSGIIF